METKIEDRLFDLAQQYASANSVKQAAKLRSQCTLVEWDLVLVEAKRIYAQRGRTR